MLGVMCRMLVWVARNTRNSISLCVHVYVVCACVCSAADLQCLHAHTTRTHTQLCFIEMQECWFLLSMCSFQAAVFTFALPHSPHQGLKP